MRQALASINKNSSKKGTKTHDLFVMLFGVYNRIQLFIRSQYLLCQSICSCLIALSASSNSSTKCRIWSTALLTFHTDDVPPVKDLLLRILLPESFAKF